MEFYQKRLFLFLFVTIEENCSKKCQLTVIAAWRLPCELHDADRTAMTNFAFRRDSNSSSPASKTATDLKA
ncbi:hypothetical protein T01_14883 [Trichinella spiralis]|uniref:Uncharacterized protein n=1 Tax=Trichinella spiralis TaxID=6334 RepID=A0A0V1AP79_TRISP|nr:hypothetical protein T01_14883 [Trichinella spiralis]